MKAQNFLKENIHDQLFDSGSLKHSFCLDQPSKEFQHNLPSIYYNKSERYNRSQIKEDILMTSSIKDAQISLNREISASEEHCNKMECIDSHCICSTLLGMSKIETCSFKQTDSLKTSNMIKAKKNAQNEYIDLLHNYQDTLQYYRQPNSVESSQSSSNMFPIALNASIYINNPLMNYYCFFQPQLHNPIPATPSSISYSKKSAFSPCVIRENHESIIPIANNMEATNNLIVKPQLSITDILRKENLAEYINSIKGSKKLQKIISQIGNQDSDLLLLFNKIYPSLGKVTNHNFGNYFCQLLLNKVGFSERQLAWKFYTRRNFGDYALHKFGSHSILSLVNSASSLNEEIFVIDQLKDYFYLLAFDRIGVQILNGVLMNYDKRSAESFFTFIKENFASISCHEVGSTIAKKVVQKWSLLHSKQKIDIICCFRKWLPLLICDEHGTTVIIEMIELLEIDVIPLLAELFNRRFKSCLLGRHSRLVVFKCFNVYPFNVNPFLLINRSSLPRNYLRRKSFC